MEKSAAPGGRVLHGPRVQQPRVRCSRCATLAREDARPRATRAVDALVEILGRAGERVPLVGDRSSSLAWNSFSDHIQRHDNLWVCGRRGSTVAAYNRGAVAKLQQDLTKVKLACFSAEEK
jgi:hypothetical protein